MIISVRDAQNNINDAAAITALLAGVTAISKSKNTLALQLTEGAVASIIDVLSGRDIKLNQIRDMYSFTDDGLDALFLRAETADLTKEHYDECVTPLLAEKENMLDILKPTKTNRITEIVSEETLENVLKHAEDVYDYVFVLLPNDNEELFTLTSKFTKEDLLIIPQGTQVPVDLSNGKTYLVVKDFESTSKYDVQSTKKKYNAKKVYTVPHNVAYRDAVISESLLDFMLINKKDMKDDDNYTFLSSILSLIGRYVSDKYEDDEEIVLKDKQADDFFEPDEPTVLPPSAVQEVTVKKGFFRKKNKIMIDM